MDPIARSPDLLAEDVFAELGGFHDLLGVERCRRTDNYSPHLGVLYHLLPVLIGDGDETRDMDMDKKETKEAFGL